MTQSAAHATPDPWAWWYRTVALGVAVISVVTGVELISNPGYWMSSPTARTFRDNSHIPYRYVGGLLILLGLMVLVRRTRQLAYLLLAATLGPFIWLVVVLLYSGHSKSPNAILTNFSLLIIFMLIAGIRYSVQIRRAGK